MKIKTTNGGAYELVVMGERYEITTEGIEVSDDIAQSLLNSPGLAVEEAKEKAKTKER